MCSAQTIAPSRRADDNARGAPYRARHLGIDEEVRQLARPALEPSRLHPIARLPDPQLVRTRPARARSVRRELRGDRRTIERVVAADELAAGQVDRDLARGRRDDEVVDRVEVDRVVAEAARSSASA